MNVIKKSVAGDWVDGEKKLIDTSVNCRSDCFNNSDSCYNQGIGYIFFCDIFTFI